MKILLSHVYAWPEVRRGAERYVHELGAALRRAGHDAEIVATAPVALRDEVLGVPVTRYRRRGSDLYAAEAGLARRALLHHGLRGVDVWHAFSTADAAAAARLGRVRNTRSLYTDPGGAQRSYRESRPDHRRFEYAVRYLDHYVCLSEATRDVLHRDYGRKGVVVGGGVDLAHFAPRAARAAIPTVLFASANDVARKNLPLLLAAFDGLLAATPARLVLAGPGSAHAELRASTARVRAATEVLDQGADLVAAYSSAWVTVLPAMREAFGLVLVESLACGTPIVAIAGSGGPAEIVGPGVGVLADAETPDALARALQGGFELVDQRDACRAEAEARYGWDEVIVPRLLELYAGK